MIVRSSKFLLLLVAAGLLGAALFGAVATWQLSRGPVSLSFLTPYVEDALSGGPDNVQVRLHDTVITWAGLERTLDLRAIGLEILDSDGEIGASVPELSVQLSLRAFMRGLIAPTGLELFGPRLRVVRKIDGEIFVGIGAVAASDQSADEGMDLVGRLLQPPDRNSATGYLRSVSVSSALIEFEDRTTGRNWTAQRADLTLERDTNGILADGIIVLDASTGSARFEVSGLLNAVTESVELGVSFEELLPLFVASLDPQLKPLERLKLPISGTLALSLSANLNIENINFDVVGGAGEILAPEYYKEPLAVKQLALQGRASEALTRVVIDSALIDLGGPVVKLSGVVSRRDRVLDFNLESSVEALPVNDLSRLWPPSIGKNARRWITKNIRDGVIDTANLSLTAATTLDDIENVKLGKTSGGFEVRGATLHYLRPMPPLRKVSGSGRFNGVDLLIEVPRGAVGELNVAAGQVAITGLTGSTPVESIRIETNIAGPLRDALELLDKDPLNFISPFGIDPQQTSGGQSTNLVLAFPLLNDLKFDQVDVAASSRLENVRAPAGVLDADISRGSFDLTVDKETLVAKGEGALSGIPVDVTWTENFSDKSALRTRYEVQAVLDDRGRETFGLAAKPYLAGPVGVELNYEIAIDGAELGVASLDLTDATMSLADFGWQKPSGQPGNATVEIAGRDGVINEITEFAVTAPRLAADGRATLTSRDDKSAISELDLSRLVVGDSDVSVRVAIGGDGVPSAIVGGEHLDLRLQVAQAFAEEGDDPSAIGVRIDDINPLRSVRLGEQSVLRNPRGRMTHDGENWTEIALTGSLSNAGQVNFQLQSANGQRDVVIETDDGGGLFRALDWVNTIEGGALKVEGAFVGTDDDEKFAGQMSLEDFKLDKSSVTVRILSLATFSGIGDVLEGTGISMRRAEMPFEVTDTEIRIGDSKARGAGVGIIAKGRIDRISEQIDLEGEIAPFTVINGLLGKIPLVGPLFDGGGDGILAATFSVKGPVDEPNVSVNPLSLLAPGILRRLFLNFGDGEGFEEGSSESPTDTPETE